MATLGEISFDINGNLTRANNGFNHFDRTIRNTGRRVSDFQGQTNRSISRTSMMWAGWGRDVARIIFKVVSAMNDYKNEALSMAVQTESNLDTLNFILKDSTKEMENFIRVGRKSLNISEFNAIKYADTYSSLFKNLRLGTDMSAKFTEALIKTSAVIQSRKPQFSMDTVMEKLRSGIIGNVNAIDDLGIEVKVGMLEMTDAFKKFANGRSFEQLDMRTQQLVRVFGILEQAGNVAGTTLADTTATSLSKLNMVFEDAKLKLGKGFLPILERSIPTLLKVAEGFEMLTTRIMMFSQALFGTDDTIVKANEKATDTQDNLKKKIEETTKAAKKSLLPFDEINNLQDQIADKDFEVNIDDMLAGMEIPGSPGEGLFENMKLDAATLAEIDMFRDTLESFKKTVSEFLNLIFDTDIDAEDFWTDVLREAVDGLNDIVTGIDESLKIINTLVSDFKTGWISFKSFVEGESGIDLTPLFQFSTPTETINRLTIAFNNIKDEITNKVKESAGIDIGGLFKFTTPGEVAFKAVNFFDSLLIEMPKKIEEVKKEITGNINEIEKQISEKLTLKIALKYVFNIDIDEIKNNFEGAKKTISEKIEEFKEGLVNGISEIENLTLKNVLKYTFNIDIDEIKSNFEETKKTISEKIEDIKNLKWFDIREAVSQMWKSTWNNATYWWDQIRERVKFKISEMVLLPWDSIKETISTMWENTKKNTKEKLSEYREIISDSILGTLLLPWSTISNKVIGIWDTITTGIKTRVEWIIDIINDMIEVVNKVKIKTPEITNPLTGNVVVKSRELGFNVNPIDKSFLGIETPDVNKQFESLNQAQIPTIDNEFLKQQELATIKNFNDLLSARNINTDFVEENRAREAEVRQTDFTPLGQAQIPTINVAVELDGKKVAKGIFDPLQEEQERRTGRRR